MGKSKTGFCLFAFVLFTVMGIPFEILFYEFFLLIFKAFSQLSPCSKVLAFYFFEFYFIFLYSRFLLVIHFIHISVYMSILISQFITPPPPATFPPWCPYVCSLHLCLYFCPANQFMCTIFLGSTYMC